ncbi:hypothetical protein AV530_019558 [Patagioenas fasciata monilis]|uniref:Uncharacterized protein n=1 Tax=Patagioenas fasciata monilis TaxID=372326 RepID=A0A1V4JE47_PATFA|nr:hypothetical protein AV530_019558 [Patagioenas fasciata monilis]
MLCFTAKGQHYCDDRNDSFRAEKENSQFGSEESQSQECFIPSSATNLLSFGLWRATGPASAPSCQHPQPPHTGNH